MRATFADPQTWRDFSWLTAHSIIGLVFGTLALTLIGSVDRARDAAAPGTGRCQTARSSACGRPTLLPLAIAAAFLAIPLAAFTVGALRLMAWTRGAAGGAAARAGAAPDHPIAAASASTAGSIAATARRP